MWDFLKGGMKKGLEYSADMLTYRALVNEWLQLPADEMAQAMYNAMLEMDESKYNRFLTMLNTMVANTRTDVQNADASTQANLAARLELLELYQEFAPQVWQKTSADMAQPAQAPEPEPEPESEPESTEAATPEEQAQTLVETLQFMQKLGANSDEMLLNMAQSLEQIEIQNKRYTRERKAQLTDFIQRVEQLPHIQDAAAKAQQLDSLTQEFITLTQAMPPEGIPRQDPRAEDADPQRRAEINQLYDLRQQLENDLATGQMTSERARELRLLLDELDDLMASPRDTPQDVMIFQAKGRDLLARLSNTIVNLDFMDAPQSDSYAGRLNRYLRGLRGLVLEEGARITSLTDSEQKVVASIQTRINEVEKVIEGNPSDDDLLKLEQETLRALALDAQKYQLRHHLMLAYPIWSSPPAFRNPNAVFYAGGESVRGLLADICADKALQLLTPDISGKDPAQERWNQLRVAHIAVFDLTAYERYENLPTDTRAEITGKVAAVAYDLGIAFTLGLPVVIVGRQNQAMPFDIDLEPVRLTGDDATDASALRQAVDDAIYSTQRESRGNAIPAAVEYVRQKYGSGGDSELEWAVSMLDDATAQDPLKMRYLLDSILMKVRTHPPQVIFPPWVGAYPAEPLCFHITAFRPHLETMRTVLMERCKAAGVRYVRGDDDVLNPQIIVSIWEHICRATHVVVDVTDFNPNAILELAMAHVLGRPTIVFSQNFDMLPYVPALSKIRILPYSPQDTTLLVDALNQFLGA